MRRFVILSIVLLSSVVAMAQRPWAELTPEEQQQVLSSRRTPNVVRSVMQHDASLKSLDSLTRAELLDRIMSRTSDHNLASLYLYIYELLREPDGSMRREDSRMLTLHSQLMYQAWSKDIDLKHLYNYAYSIGRLSSEQGAKSAKALVPKMSKKKEMQQYRIVAHHFARAVEIARDSELAAEGTFQDVTAPVQLEQSLLILSEKAYEAVVDGVEPLVLHLAEPADEVEEAMRKECITWSGAYNTAIKSNVVRGVELVRSNRAEGEYLTINAVDHSYSVENELYLLASGRFVAVERGAEVPSLILGRITAKGALEIRGKVYIDFGREVLDVKCNEAAVYLRVKSGDKVEYLMLPLK